MDKTYFFILKFKSKKDLLMESELESQVFIMDNRIGPLRSS
jgi:hypothetical protein